MTDTPVSRGASCERPKTWTWMSPTVLGVMGIHVHSSLVNERGGNNNEAHAVKMTFVCPLESSGSREVGLRHSSHQYDGLHKT